MNTSLYKWNIITTGGLRIIIFFKFVLTEYNVEFCGIWTCLFLYQ